MSDNRFPAAVADPPAANGEVRASPMARNRPPSGPWLARDRRLSTFVACLLQNALTLPVPGRTIARNDRRHQH